MGEALSLWKRLKQPHADFVLSCIVVALIAGFFLYPDMREKEFWTGDRGWLEVLAPIGTVLAASAAAWLAWRNFKLGQQKDVSERFQKGVELIEKENAASVNAGIIILEDLAIAEEGGRHQAWISEFLESAVAGWNTIQSEALPVPLPAQHNFAPTFRRTIRAITAMSKLPRSLGSRTLPLPRGYLCDVFLQGLPLNGLAAGNGVFSNATFVECHLTGGLLRGQVYNSLEFEACDMSQMRISMNKLSSGAIAISDCDLSNASLLPPEGVDLDISGCKVDGLNISGRGDTVLSGCWYTDKPPTIRYASALSWETTGIFRAGSSRHSTQRRTFTSLVVWEPDAEDVEVPPELVASPAMVRSGKRMAANRKKDEDLTAS